MTGIGPGLGMYTLSKTNFQLKNLWMFYINETSPQGLVEDLFGRFKGVNGASTYKLSEVIQGGLDIYGDLVDPLSMANLCKRVNLPRQTFETQTHGQTNTKYYTKAEPYQSVSVEFWETENHDIEKYFTAWERKFFNRETKTFIAGKNPKRTGHLTVFQKAGAGVATGLIKGAGSFLTDAARKVNLGGAVGSFTKFSGGTFDQVSSWLPTGVYHYKGLLYKGMEAIEFDHEEGGGMGVRVNFEVDLILPTELGGVGWTSLQNLAVNGAKMAVEYLESVDR